MKATRYRKGVARSRSIQRNPRFEISRGELLRSYEPHDMPGAFIFQWHRVKDSEGRVPSGQIEWHGPGEWITSRDGVPKGHTALWLGTREATRPFVVFVEDAPTPYSDDYDKGYRRAWKAKRKPTVPQTATEGMVQGMLDGWRDAQRARGRGGY